jgi:hypothetical protein
MGQVRVGNARIYLKDLDPAVTGQVWERFSAALDPLRAERKLGAILLQFPPWFPIGKARKDYIVACTDAELKEWAPKVLGLAGQAETTHVLFNKLLPRLRPDQRPAARRPAPSLTTRPRPAETGDVQRASRGRSREATVMPAMVAPTRTPVSSARLVGMPMSSQRRALTS